MRLVLVFFALLGLGHCLASCGLQPSPRPADPAKFGASIPPAWWSPSEMQCGNATPYPYDSWADTPDCGPDNPPNSPWSSQTCTCFEDAFSRCPESTEIQHCSKNQTTGRFDSVQGQCFGALQPRWGWILSACDSSGEGGPTPLGAACILNPFTKLDVRYAAAYQLSLTGDAGSKPAWLLQQGSSINTDGSQGELANLSTIQQPSMGAEWGSGYYNRNTMGVGPPGMLFVLSVNKAYNFAWYLVNQLTLDRCPDCSKPNCKIPATKGLPAFNCWGDAPGAEAGEIDLLETPFWSCKGFPELCNSKGYGRMYMTSGNSKGFCNPKLHSAYCSNYTACGMGGHGSTNFFDVGDTSTNDGGPHVYAAVVDAMGITLYRDPTWSGLTAGAASPILTSLRPDIAPESASAPCGPSPSSCARFSPLCVTRPSNETTFAIVPQNQSRLITCPGQGSFGMSSACIANSWWNSFADTGQWPAEVSSAEPQS